MHAKRITGALLAAAALYPASASAVAPRATVPAIVAPRPAVEPGTSQTEYPWWGNATLVTDPSPGIADCTFAASADWEMIVLHRTPSEAALISEFHRAGGSNSEGLGSDVWHTWWAKHGIAGVKVQLIERPNSWLDWIVQHYGAAVAVAANHAVVVDGFNSTGPEVVTYGGTEQATWREWREWGIEIFEPRVRSVQGG